MSGSPVHIARPKSPGDTRARLLEGPILETLLRLSVPNIALVGAQASINVAETYFVGRLGTEALAGVSLVFPIVMLMQMMSAGAMGGGISSAVARALGAHRQNDAEALAWHAVLIALVLGAGFTLAVLVFGPGLYRLLGGSEASLANALQYSNIVFGGAVFVWLMNSLASVLRGSGDMRTPALITVFGAVIMIAVSPLLIFGAGPLPGMGLRGAAIALVAYYIAGCVLLGWRVLRGATLVSLRPCTASWRHFSEILKVGVPACLHAALINTAVGVTTGFVGVYGAAALAGYGIGARLEYLQIPIVFGLGATLVAMVGTNVGAGQLERARKIAWTGGLFAAAVCGAIGSVVAIAPQLWAGMFTRDPEVLAIATQYFHIAGPAYAFLGLGMALYFSFQGTGRMLWPMLCVSARILIIAAGCTLATRAFALGLGGLFAVTAVALVSFGTMYAVGVWRFFLQERGLRG
ncbi:MAG: MATE family efflux transporter [Burkholderiales bacterium]|nr:MATE family efflux transporter [Burkholderiales bacterium]